MGLEMLGTLIGAVTFLGGVLAWYRSSVETNYAQKREFNHLRNNQEQLSENLKFIAKEMDSRFDGVQSQLLELKGMFYASLRGGTHE
ncbi:hypothetical protein Glo7428_3758 [Gloeocapsa sp. PCC 7428]|nr:hypothetical protein Glo7428_3758 [Gloeocapsa sp. PCC 7428]